MAINAISNSNAYAGYTASQRVRGGDTGQATELQPLQPLVPQKEPSSVATDKAAGTKAAGTTSTDAGNANPAKKTSTGKAELTPEELAQVAKLAARDREVRQHEAAHLAASGGLATSGASFSYQKGPDGVNYAIGGEVSIDTSAGRTPEETIQRAQTIQAAALAPAEPSGADRAVAAAAQQLAAQARLELAQQAQTETGTQSAETSVKQTERKSEPAEPAVAGQIEAVQVAAAAKVAQAYVQPNSATNRSRAVNVFA